MLTEFGKMLRVIRIQNNEVMYDMANKMSVTSSYLSAIENGKRSIPRNFIDKLVHVYGLSVDDRLDLMSAADLSAQVVKFNISQESEFKKELVVSFARSFDDLDETTIKKLQHTLNSFKGGKK